MRSFKIRRLKRSPLFLWETIGKRCFQTFRQVAGQTENGIIVTLCLCCQFESMRLFLNKQSDILKVDFVLFYLSFTKKKNLNRSIDYFFYKSLADCVHLLYDQIVSWESEIICWISFPHPMIMDRELIRNQMDKQYQQQDRNRHVLLIELPWRHENVDVSYYWVHRKANQTSTCWYAVTW